VISPPLLEKVMEPKEGGNEKVRNLSRNTSSHKALCGREPEKKGRKKGTSVKTSNPTSGGKKGK